MSEESIIRRILIKKVNNSFWWHVTPKDPKAYKKRGKFLTSTFLQASFYGRPNDIPNRVSIRNPIFGFSELEILRKLFGNSTAIKLLEELSDNDNWYASRIALDAKMHIKAKSLGYDCVILMTGSGKNALLRGRKPNSMELNLLDF
jgi:hypothetical protein